MKKNKLYIIAFLIICGLYACKHDVLNNNTVINTDTTVIVAPPIGGGSTTTPTTPAVSDTVCFNTDILPLYVSYCGSAGCHDASSQPGNCWDNTADV